MTVGEAIETQKEYVANKYNKSRYQNEELKESMKVLTKAYDELWEFLESEHQEILDKFLLKGE